MLSNTQARAAMLKAADQIQQRPDEFNFSSSGIPYATCGSPGCALGWVEFFANKAGWRAPPSDRTRLGIMDSHRMLGLDEIVFYSRMDDLEVEHLGDPNVLGEDSWIDSAEKCAKVLRLYADKYHPEPVSIKVAVKEAVNVE